MKIILAGLLALFVAFQSSQALDTPIDNDAYVLEQSIDSNEFKEVATLNLRILKQNQNSALSESYSHNSDQEAGVEQHKPPKDFSTLVPSSAIDHTIKQQIKSALRSSPNALYHLRLCKKSQAASGAAKSCQASSFTYLNSVVESDFTVNLTLHAGLNNRLNALSIKTVRAASGSNKDIDDLDFVNFYVSVRNMKLAQIPDTETYLEKVKKELEQKEKGAQADNQSFLSKYWIYIVPFVVIMFIMQIANPEGASAGGR